MNAPATLLAAAALLSPPACIADTDPELEAYDDTTGELALLHEGDACPLFRLGECRPPLVCCYASGKHCTTPQACKDAQQPPPPPDLALKCNALCGHVECLSCEAPRHEECAACDVCPVPR